MAQTTSDAPSGLVAFDPQMDRPPARRPDHPDLADRLGPGLARLARRDGQPAALCGDERRCGADPIRLCRRRASGRSAPGERLMSIRYPEHGEGPVLVTAAQAPRPGEGRPVRTNVWLDPGRRPRARQGVERRRPGPGLPRPPRQPDGAGLGPHDRRLGRRVHVPLLPHRPLAVVADDRQREARLPLEAAEFDQRQSPPPDGLLDRAAAGDAELHRLLDLLPERVSAVRGEPARQGQGRPAARSCPRDARPPARPDRADARGGAGGGAAARDRPARHASPGRPIRRPSGRSPSSARAARPRSR